MSLYDILTERARGLAGAGGIGRRIAQLGTGHGARSAIRDRAPMRPRAGRAPRAAGAAGFPQRFQARVSCVSTENEFS